MGLVYAPAKAGLLIDLDPPESLTDGTLRRAQIDKRRKEKRTSIALFEPTLLGDCVAPDFIAALSQHDAIAPLGIPKSVKSKPKFLERRRQHLDAAAVAQAIKDAVRTAGLHR